MHIGAGERGYVVRGHGGQTLHKHLALAGLRLVALYIHTTGAVESDVAAEGNIAVG